MRQNRTLTFFGVLLLCGLLFTGFSRNSDVFFQIKKNFTIFSEVFQEVSTRYVDEVEPEKLMRHGINSMLEKLDPYTVLFDEADNQNMEILTTGRYAGVGVEVGARGGRLVIIAPIEGYSAHRRGVRAGDIIIEVDGISVSNMSVDDLQLLIRGDAGSTLNLTIERFGFDEYLQFELVREHIEVNNIQFAGFIDSKKEIGYISLARFGQNTSRELRKAISDLKSESELSGLIIDLRNNPGGLLDEAVNTVDLFVPPGIEVVSTRGRSIESTFKSRTEAPVFYAGPLVILQNNGSASSSEIVAGALQDLDRAVIVGNRSFGKGLVQIIRPLSYNVALKITTSRYYIPSGRSIQSVNYSQDDESTSVQIPDSLRQKFTTRAGRTVFDGVGIDPDILLADRTPTLVETSLLQHSMYFFFANEYQLENPDLPNNLNSDETFEKFLNYLERENFNFTTRQERFLSQLENEIPDEVNRQHNLENSLRILREAFEHQKQEELRNNATWIKRELYLELVSRYEGRIGRLQRSLQTDELVQKAVDILSDENQYVLILSP